MNSTIADKLMARLARIVIPNYPHHITQRGNRRQKTFFSADDYQIYIELLAEAKHDAGVSIWAYCLMPNHVHLIAVPDQEDGLARLFRHSHRRYTRHINFREGWRGHLWQERFHSFVMDQNHLLAAVRYVELNPVRARLCNNPQDWPWSSAGAHLNNKDDSLVTVAPMLQRVSNWNDYLEVNESAASLNRLRQYSRTGRPAGNNSFIDQLELLSGRELHRKKPGPKAIDK